MHRFYFSKKIEDPQNIIISDKKIINKLTKVLRKSVGDTFILFDNQADEYEVRIAAINSKRIVCQFLNKSFIDRELDLEINLYQSLLKKDKFEWILQKATEIGVKKIIPVISAHCILKDLNKNKQQRYQKIINEATMQCGGKIAPSLGELVSFNQAITSLNIQDLNLIAHEQEQKNELSIILQNNNKNKINLFVGPEGGFSEQEIELAKKHFVTSFRLGKRILRAETAAIVACALLANH